jgi:hypothetical protein
MGTAEMAKELGVSTATVFRYVDRGLLQPLLRDPAILVAGEEFARFKREDWPLLPRRKGRPKKSMSLKTYFAMKRAMRRSR